jgi:hypothetical protein
LHRFRRFRTATTATPGAGWGPALLLAAAALLLFLALPQRTLHGADGDQFVVWLEQGRRDYPRHVAYLHLAGLVFGAGRAFGIGAYQALLLTSALGSAFAVLCLHRAFAVLSPWTGGRTLAPTLAALVTAPGFFYATCAEIHGVFVAGAALSWWAFAHWLRRPRVARGLLTGAASGLAASVHAFGHLLPPLFVLAAVLLVRLPRQGRWRTVAALVGAHACLAALLGWWLGAGPAGPACDATQYVAEQLPWFAPATAPEVLLREWIAPYLPWSVLAVAGLLVARARPWACVTVAGLALHLPLTTLLLGHHHIDERGAYQLALVLPAIVTSLRLLPASAFWLAPIASASLAVVTTLPEWRTPVSAAFVRGVASLHAARPLVLVVARQELDGLRTQVPDLNVIDFAAALEAYRTEWEQACTFDRWFDACYDEFERRGQQLLLSASVRARFAILPAPDIRRFWDQYVPQHYALVPERRFGFAGCWVVRLPTR